MAYITDNQINIFLLKNNLKKNQRKIWRFHLNKLHLRSIKVQNIF